MVAVTSGLVCFGFASNALADEPRYSIAANVNDVAIVTTRGPNLVWLANDPVRRVGKPAGPRRPPTTR